MGQLLTAAEHNNTTIIADGCETGWGRFENFFLYMYVWKNIYFLFVQLAAAFYIDVLYANSENSVPWEAVYCTYCTQLKWNMELEDSIRCLSSYFFIWSNQLQQTYTEISEVLVVVQSVAHQKGIWHLKTNVWNKYTDTTNVSHIKSTKQPLLSAVEVKLLGWSEMRSGNIYCYQRLCGKQIDVALLLSAWGFT